MNTDLERDILAFWSLLFEIISDMEKRLASHMAAHQLTPPQFYVLKTLFEHGGQCRIGQIAVEHHLTNATMTGLVKRLEAMKPPLVMRERSSEDARSVNVILTEAGNERFWAVQNGLLDQARAVFSLIPADERQQALEKVRLYFKLLVEQFPLSAQEASGAT